MPTPYPRDLAGYGRNPPDPKGLPRNLEAAFYFLSEVLRQGRLRNPRRTAHAH